MQKRMMKLITALLTAVLLFAAAIPLGGATMRADAAEGELHDLWYFTDSDDSAHYIDEAIEESNLGGDLTFHHKFWPFDEFYNNLSNFLHEEPNAVHDAYVVFEMGGIHDWLGTVISCHNNSEPFHSEVLNTIEKYFETWRNANCKIMAIWGMDEYMIEGDTDFLQYADIQINTNVIYPIFYSMLRVLNSQDKYLFASSAGENMGQYILMNAMERFGSALDLYSNVFFRFFAFYFVQNAPLSQSVPGSLDEIINELNKNSTILRYMPYSYTDVDIMNTVGIGNAAGNLLEFQEWENKIERLRYESLVNFPVFVFDPTGSVAANWITEGTPKENIYYATAAYGTLNKYVPKIVEDFILDKNLRQYNNWEGSAPVNFKPILPGQDGWVDSGPLSNFPFPWDL